MYSKRRKSELEYYQKNAAGEYVYTGRWYAYQAAVSRKRLLAELWGCCAGAALAALLAGMFPAPGMTGCWYVPVPYVLSLVTAVSVLWSLGQLTAAGDPVRAFILDTACKQLPRRAQAVAALTGLCALGEGVYLLRQGGDTGPALRFLGLMVLSCILTVAGRFRMAHLKWEPQN